MNCIVFTSDKVLSIKPSVKQWNGTIEYSYDNIKWKTWQGKQKLSNKHIYLRGVNNTVITNLKRWIINGENVRCQGNIENLLDYKLVQQNIHPKMDDCCFAYMFEDCGCLIEMPQLLSMDLSTFCYGGMFLSCYSLRKTTDLPAIKLEKDCYLGMFGGCSSLTEMPNLPATTLAEGCYEYMFAKCNSLIEVTDLPAIKLKKCCYKNMFSDCCELIKIPNFPCIEEFAEKCYYQMFSNCQQLQFTIRFPNLLVATNAFNDYIFEGCKSVISLKEITVNNKPCKIETIIMVKKLL